MQLICCITLTMLALCLSEALQCKCTTKDKLTQGGLQADTLRVLTQDELSFCSKEGTCDATKWALKRMTQADAPYFKPHVRLEGRCLRALHENGGVVHSCFAATINVDNKCGQLAKSPFHACLCKDGDYCNVADDEEVETTETARMGVANKVHISARLALFVITVHLVLMLRE